MAETKTMTEINWLNDYDKALQQAKKENKRVFLDFWVDG